MFYDFQTTTYGKWILLGEHAVLRGHGALVFPVRSKYLNLTYQPSTSKLNASYKGETGADIHLLFWSVLEQGMQILGLSLNSLSGHFILDSNVPIGLGMGASAALCVAVARWFVSQKLLDIEMTYHFAKELENLFHGQSSGIDIAGVATPNGVFFKQDKITPLNPKWQPQWVLSSCGQIGITSHCIQQIATIWKENELLALKLDQQMNNAANQAVQALEEDSSDAEQNLIDAIKAGADCFKQWGLVSESLQQHMDQLKEAGALAVKPTGSGGGGYVVSLWKSLPDPLLPGMVAI